MWALFTVDVRCSLSLTERLSAYEARKAKSREDTCSGQVG